MSLSTPIFTTSPESLPCWAAVLNGRPAMEAAAATAKSLNFMSISCGLGLV